MDVAEKKRLELKRGCVSRPWVRPAPTYMEPLPPTFYQVLSIPANRWDQDQHRPLALFNHAMAWCVNVFVLAWSSWPRHISNGFILDLAKMECLVSTACILTKDAASGCRQNATRLTICSKLVVKEKDAELENVDEKVRRNRKMVALWVISCDLDGEVGHAQLDRRLLSPCDSRALERWKCESEQCAMSSRRALWDNILSYLNVVPDCSAEDCLLLLVLLHRVDKARSQPELVVKKGGDVWVEVRHDAEPLVVPAELLHEQLPPWTILSALKALRALGISKGPLQNQIRLRNHL